MAQRLILAASAALALMGSVVAHAPVYYPKRDPNAEIVTVVNCSAYAHPPIVSFHIHVVYSLFMDEQLAAAIELRDMARKHFTTLGFLGADCPGRFDEGRLCLIYDHDLNTTLIGGPFPSGEWSMFIPVSMFPVVVPWFIQHYQDTWAGFSLLVHTNTGCEYEDHSIWAGWYGIPYPLNMEIFQKYTQSNEFNASRGDIDNPICVAKGDTCGTVEDGPVAACCAGFTCACDGPCACA